MYSYCKNRHSCYRLIYHLVVTTNDGKKVINKEVSERLESIFKDIMKNSWKCDVIEFKGYSDYIHVSFSAPPQVELAKLINNLKTVSSRRIRKEFLGHISRYYDKPSFWSNSYLILSTGGDTREIIHKYLESK